MTTAFVLGGAQSVWAEFRLAAEMTIPHMIVATNDAGSLAESVDHWVTLHPEKFRSWAQARRDSGLQPAGRVWCHRAPTSREVQGTGYEGLFGETHDWGGSSGLLAVKVALEQGADRVILCGVPMTAQGAHFFDSAEWRWAERYRTGWQRHLPDIAGRVRSMGGWTEQLLGRPDRVWLNIREESTSGAQGST